MAEEKKQIVEAKIVEITTETAPMIQIGEEILTDRDVLIRIYNDLQLIKRGLL